MLSFFLLALSGEFNEVKRKSSYTGNKWTSDWSISLHEWSSVTSIFSYVLEQKTVDSADHIGNNLELCLLLRPFLKKYVDAGCELFESVRCSSTTYSDATTCLEGFEPKTMDNRGTFRNQLNLAGGDLNFNPLAETAYANGSISEANYRQVWGMDWAPRNLRRTVRNAEIN